MAPTPRFCTQCGAAVAANARFCAQCGTPVKLPPAPQIRQQQPVADPPTIAPPPPPPAARAPFAPPAAPVAPAASGEPIVNIILGLQRQKGFLGMGVDNYSLILTPGRMIFAHLDNKAMQVYVQRARDAAKAEGKGFFGQWGAQLSWLKVLERDLQSASPDQILAAGPNNFFIPNAAVSRVRVRQTTDSETDTTTYLVVVIETTSGKHKFRIPSGVGMAQRELKHQLSQTLGAIVK